MVSNEICRTGRDLDFILCTFLRMMSLFEKMKSYFRVMEDRDNVNSKTKSLT